jgi:hypothetical protein
MWLSEYWASRIYFLSSLFFLASLAVGAVTSLLIFMTGNAKDAYLRKQLANAGVASANANERAAKAELETAKLKKEVLLLGKRDPLLWTDVRLPIVAELKEFKGQRAEIKYSEAPTRFGDLEPVAFAMGLGTLLKDSEWVLEGSPNPGTFQGDIGLIIEISPRATGITRKAAESLIACLLKVPLKVGWNKQPKEDESVHNDEIQALVFSR